jgi:rare lipoprotein A (peptidoglycan hydrolase)
MRMQRALGVSLAALVLSTGALTKQALSADPRDGTPARGAAGFGAPDRYIAPATRQAPTFQVVGRREVGRASWYGNYHVGRLTATGERLDTAHPTAAHRTLPMYSLVKVTNLKNGRSVVVTINDRGPVSRRLSIDVSPRAADELEMRHDGVIPVTIEQVAVARTNQ